MAQQITNRVGERVTQTRTMVDAPRIVKVRRSQVQAAEALIRICGEENVSPQIRAIAAAKRRPA